MLVSVGRSSARRLLHVVGHPDGTRQSSRPASRAGRPPEGGPVPSLHHPARRRRGDLPDAGPVPDRRGGRHPVPRCPGASRRANRTRRVRPRRFSASQPANCSPFCSVPRSCSPSASGTTSGPWDHTSSWSFSSSWPSWPRGSAMSAWSSSSRTRSSRPCSRPSGSSCLSTRSISSTTWTGRRPGSRPLPARSC